MTEESALEDATERKEAGESSTRVQADGEWLSTVIRTFQALLVGTAPVDLHLYVCPMGLVRNVLPPVIQDGEKRRKSGNQIQM